MLVEAKGKVMAIVESEGEFRGGGGEEGRGEGKCWGRRREGKGKGGVEGEGECGVEGRRRRRRQR